MKEAGDKPHLQDFLQASAPIPPQTDEHSSLNTSLAVSQPRCTIWPQHLPNNSDDEFVPDLYEDSEALN